MGDFGKYYKTQKSIPVPTYFCKGNHEDFEFLENHVGNREVLPNLFYVPNGQVHEIQRVNIGFLGANFSSRWFDRPVPKKGVKARKFWDICAKVKSRCLHLMRVQSIFL